VGKSIETKTDQGHDMTPREAIDIKQLHLINFDKYHNKKQIIEVYYLIIYIEITTFK